MNALLRLGAPNPGGSIHYPLLEGAPVQGRQEFYDWWLDTAISTGEGGFTRKDTVLALANREGDAHVDSKMPKANEKLRRSGVGFVFTHSEGGLVDGGNPALPPPCGKSPTRSRRRCESRSTASSTRPDGKHGRGRRY